jgi:hypothetical protein
MEHLPPRGSVGFMLPSARLARVRDSPWHAMMIQQGNLLRSDGFTGECLFCDLFQNMPIIDMLFGFVMAA